MLQEVIFDVETQKLFNEITTNDPADLGISLVSVYVRQINDKQEEIGGTMYSFWDHELAGMWPLFEDAKRIIGFNSRKFDVPALSPRAPKNFSRLPHFDIMEFVRSALGFSLSLDSLVQHSLGREKTDVGTNAVKYWKSQNPQLLQKLKNYCEADVLLTRDLYDFGVKNKFLKYRDKWNNLLNIEVDFSYPKEVIDSTRQIGLF
ncbi:ribonuclease H-like domain-containing protein [Patescibacteria group bacterium]|nr:ribonuclease H-like domain-containing protein [Patescibacteria group bacterium]MBU1472563.1 ribonuclease H-like domain-containing protein [Patescibacteria group bacterium]MBU2459814.1 ribonuclease H-like domain-containing protein [Patescibacteria group bacterium]MBU2544124.1 ribonuclease H-like domain-containing protein [Patescibacteria group bacterium]